MESMDNKNPMSPVPPTEPEDPSRGSRRPYATPRLVEYGSVAKLTHGGGSLQADGGSTFKRTRAKCL